MTLQAFSSHDWWTIFTETRGISCLSFCQYRLCHEIIITDLLNKKEFSYWTVLTDFSRQIWEVSHSLFFLIKIAFNINMQIQMIGTPQNNQTHHHYTVKTHLYLNINWILPQLIDINGEWKEVLFYPWGKSTFLFWFCFCD